MARARKALATGDAISIEEYQSGTKRKHKFNATRTFVNHIGFDSKRESERYIELLTVQTHSSAQLIRNLQTQRTFEFFTCGCKVERWRIDFCYEEWNRRENCWNRIAEDVTGFMTARKTRLIRLFEEQYGLDNNYTDFEKWDLRISK